MVCSAFELFQGINKLKLMEKVTLELTQNILSH